MNFIEKAYKRLLRSKLNMPPPDEKPHEGFKLIYTDNKGNKYYSLVNPANLHATRALMAWTYSKDSEFGLTTKKLKGLLERINESVNKKDIATIAKITGVMEAALDLYAEPEILINLATCYVFLNDEKNEGYKDFIQQQKLDLWKSDNDARSFFLQFAVQYTSKYSELQRLNVLDYLERAKPVLDQINYHLTGKK